ncbi:hypothetical protein MAR_020802 [Mya arenaria]|uniref:Ig-like domain-containing protein n=1 Tax=Mya arenaria TaxID=6604 RepID=A0ABY7E5W5_MYAAR|nr:hypothetical protein MAR_020802 [Mya arenaria]
MHHQWNFYLDLCCTSREHRQHYQLHKFRKSDPYYVHLVNSGTWKNVWRQFDPDQCPANRRPRPVHPDSHKHNGSHKRKHGNGNKLHIVFGEYTIRNFHPYCILLGFGDNLPRARYIRTSHDAQLQQLGKPEPRLCLVVPRGGSYFGPDLIFTSVQTTLAGNVTCITRNTLSPTGETALDKTKQTTANPPVTPSCTINATLISTTAILLNGTDGNIICTSSAMPTPISYTWSTQGRGIVSGAYLSLTNVQHPADQGQYTLTVTNTMDPTGEIMETAQRILKSDLGMSHVRARWVPRLLTVEEKDVRVRASRTFVRKVGRDLANYNNIRDLGFKRAIHPPYSPDLAPLDFAYFPKLKTFHEEHDSMIELRSAMRYKHKIAY